MDRGRGLVFVVSAPSGAGKTSLCRDVAGRLPNLKYAISYTTRPPRVGEVDGRDYFFVGHDAFQDHVEKSNFVEWAEIYGYLYGTSRAWMADQVGHGVDVILDLDTQGAQALRAVYPDAASIYLLPPSLDILRERLIRRQSDTPEEVEKRLQMACIEMESYRQYDYVIVNAEYTTARTEIEAIILAKRARIGHIDLTWLDKILGGDL